MDYKTNTERLHGLYQYLSASNTRKFLLNCDSDIIEWLCQSLNNLLVGLFKIDKDERVWIDTYYGDDIREVVEINGKPIKEKRKRQLLIKLEPILKRLLRTHVIPYLINQSTSKKET